jgi:hypothetical protein
MKSETEVIRELFDDDSEEQLRMWLRTGTSGGPL